MNSNQSTCRAGAFSLVELLCVIAIISILAALILPVLNQGQARVKRIECENNLRQLGITFQMFMHEHDDKFPMSLPVAAGGSQEFVQNGYALGGEFYFSYRHFQVLSNELNSPGPLVCPADTRLPATNFAALQNSNLSYFVGVKARFANPNSILAGDRNITANSFPNPSLLHIDTDNRLSWTWELHRFKGNLLFADGRVEEWNNAALATGAGGQLAGADLFLPSVPPQATYAVSSPAGYRTYPRVGSGGETSPTTASAEHPEHNLSGAPGASGQFQTRQPSVVSVGLSNPPVPAATNPPAASRFSSNPPVTVTIAPVETESDGSTWDRRVVENLRRIIIGTYLLVLLFFLLRLAYVCWRRVQRRKMQGEDGL